MDKTDIIGSVGMSILFILFSAACVAAYIGFKRMADNNERIIKEVKLLVDQTEAKIGVIKRIVSNGITSMINKTTCKKKEEIDGKSENREDPNKGGFVKRLQDTFLPKN